MPRISSFCGIAIYMHWNEAHHARPHFHARYAGRAASVDLEGNVIAGVTTAARAWSGGRVVTPAPRRARGQLGAGTAREALEAVDPLP